MGGMALANFHLERLGVIWNADSDLSGWVGSFDMRNICQGGVTWAPWQHPVGLNPPPEKPENHADRRYIVYSDLILKISLSPCPGGWSEIKTSLSSNFGFNHIIPYLQPRTDLIDLSHQVGDSASNIEGKRFTLSGETIWNYDSFSYSTEEGTIYENQIATLVQSPVLDFAILLFQPYPE